MIAKVVSRGRSSMAMVSYVARGNGRRKREQTRLLATNMATPKDEDGVSAQHIADWALELELQGGVVGPSSQHKHIDHLLLSFHPDEPLMAEKGMIRLSERFLEEMGYIEERRPYLAYLHEDKDHRHIHILTTPYDSAGQRVVSDSFNGLRARRVGKELRSEFRLQAVVPDEAERRAPRLSERELAVRTGEPTGRQSFQEAIERVGEQAPDWHGFLRALQAEGFEVRFRVRQADGQPTGISLSRGEFRFSGSQLGKRYTFAGLDRAFDLGYEPSQAGGLARVIEEKIPLVVPAKHAEATPVPAPASGSASASGPPELSRLGHEKFDFAVVRSGASRLLRSEDIVERRSGIHKEKVARLDPWVRGFGGGEGVYFRPTEGEFVALRGISREEVDRLAAFGESNEMVVQYGQRFDVLVDVGEDRRAKVEERIAKLAMTPSRGQYRDAIRYPGSVALNPASDTWEEVKFVVHRLNPEPRKPAGELSFEDWIRLANQPVSAVEQAHLNRQAELPHAPEGSDQRLLETQLAGPTSRDRAAPISDGGGKWPAERDRVLESLGRGELPRDFDAVQEVHAGLSARLAEAAASARSLEVAFDRHFPGLQRATDGAMRVGSPETLERYQEAIGVAVGLREQLDQAEREYSNLAASSHRLQTERFATLIWSQSAEADRLAAVVQQVDKHVSYRVELERQAGERAVPVALRSVNSADGLVQANEHTRDLDRVSMGVLSRAVEARTPSALREYLDVRADYQQALQVEQLLKERARLAVTALPAKVPATNRDIHSALAKQLEGLHGHAELERTFQPLLVGERSRHSLHRVASGDLSPDALRELNFGLLVDGPIRVSDISRPVEDLKMSPIQLYQATRSAQQELLLLVGRAAVPGGLNESVAKALFVHSQELLVLQRKFSVATLAASGVKLPDLAVSPHRVAGALLKLASVGATLPGGRAIQHAASAVLFPVKLVGALNPHRALTLALGAGIRVARLAARAAKQGLTEG